MHAGMAISCRTFPVLLALTAMFMPASAADTLSPPGNVRVTNVRHDGFTAEWDAADGAELYMVRRYVTAAAVTQHDRTLLEEGFDKAHGGTMDNVSYVTDISEITESGGWKASAAAQSEGNFVFAPMLYPVVLTTCPLPVAAGNEIEVSLNMAEYHNERFLTGGVLDVTLEEIDGSASASRSVVVTQAGFADYTVVFPATGAPAEVKVVLSYAGNGSRGKLFLDGIKVEQRVNAGDLVHELAEEILTEECSVDFKVERADGVSHSFAVASVMTGDNHNPAAMSRFTGQYFVEITDASVSRVGTDDTPSAWISAPGKITAVGENVGIYALDGRCIYNGRGGEIAVTERTVVVISGDKPLKFSL